MWRHGNMLVSQVMQRPESVANSEEWMRAASASYWTDNMQEWIAEQSAKVGSGAFASVLATEPSATGFTHRLHVASRCRVRSPTAGWAPCGHHCHSRLFVTLLRLQAWPVVAFRHPRSASHALHLTLNLDPGCWHPLCSRPALHSLSVVGEPGGICLTCAGQYRHQKGRPS